jgi:hypothetical protein
LATVVATVSQRHSLVRARRAIVAAVGSDERSSVGVLGFLPAGTRTTAAPRNVVAASSAASTLGGVRYSARASDRSLSS